MPRQKKSPYTQLAAFELPRQTVPTMPEGYYSGDKPNPNLHAFVEAHVNERPYDPATDNYDVPAFDKPIDATKATATYNMHMYWSKKPHDAIREYIHHYTQPGDLVLDPFCGSGGTALAALMEGRKAIAIDRSPAATFITKNYCTPVNVAELQSAIEKLKATVQSEIDWLYETRCDRCGGSATTGYTVYSQVFQCPRCMEQVALFDCVEVEGKTAAGKPKTISACPNCQKRGFVEEINTRSRKFGAMPVLVRYECQNGCKPAKDERRHNDQNSKKREYFEKCDLGKLREIEVKTIPHWYPQNKMMNVEDDSQPWGDKWRAGTSNFRTVAELYTKRNLWALAACRAALAGLALPDSISAASALWTVITTLSLTGTKMLREEKRAIQSGTYYLPPVFREIKIFNGLEYNAFQLTKAEEALLGSFSQLPELIISTQSALLLEAIPANSLDYVFTDPPYAEMVQYGELNFVWEAWLSFDTHWHDDEIIVNEVRGRTEEDWSNMLRSAMAECYRVLKPGRWLSLCFHGSESTWALVQDIMVDVGFFVDSSAKTLFIDAGQKSYNQTMADKVNQRDLVINFRKPRPDEGQASIKIMGNEDAATFSEKVREMIGAFLLADPGATKDRIYDNVVSRMVRAGQMEAHNFDELLVQVADPVREPLKQDFFTDKPPDLFGYNAITRWYLREAEAGAEESQHKLEQATAEKIEGFLRETTAEALHRTQSEWEELRSDQAEKQQLLGVTSEDDLLVKRSKVSRELRDIERRLDKLESERAEWGQMALHYSPILEFYLPLGHKPKLTLFELLEDYFYQTEGGNWRPPADESDRAARAERRGQAAHRQIRRLCRLLRAGEVVPHSMQPNSATLAEWIRYCKKSELYEEGKLLFEKGGLDLEVLTDEEQVGVEEDYQVCVRRLAALI